MIRYLVAAPIIAVPVLLAVGAALGRARVQSCCGGSGFDTQIDPPVEPSGSTSSGRAITSTAESRPGR